MKARIPVSSIMTTNLVKLNICDSLTKAESLFKEHKVRHLPVVSGVHIVGMLSYADLLRISLADGVDDEGEIIDTTVYNMFSLEQVMTKSLVTIQVSENIKTAAEIFVSKEFRALPVLDGDRLVGMLTTTDLIQYLLEQYK